MKKPTSASQCPQDTRESFPFIVSNGPGTVKDPTLRTLIRKQAMRDVAIARKKRGNHGRVNIGQSLIVESETKDPNEALAGSIPAETSSTSRSPSDSPEAADYIDRSSDSASTATLTATTEYSEEESACWSLIPRDRMLPHEISLLIPCSLSFDTAYERSRAKFSVDITSLSRLTNFNIGKSAVPDVSADPVRLAGLIQEQQWSYLEFVPAMYNSSRCLAAATDCLLSKTSDVLRLSCNPGQTLLLYAKAIKALQEAISDPQQCADADVLCAIQLMSLHELLDPSRTKAFSHHIIGSSKLVKHRGPAKFKTEYEKALFAGHIGAMVSEAILDTKPCYLEAPEWMDLYTSLVEDTVELTDRHELVIGARKQMFPIPGLWYDIGEALEGPDLYDDEKLLSLEKRCRELQQRYLDWMEEYKSHCVRLSLASPSLQELHFRRELFGSVLECLVVMKRLLQCLITNQGQIRALEEEVQALAKLMLEIQDQSNQPKYSWLFEGHEIGIAKNAQLTKWVFERLATEKVDMRKRYTLWNASLRMEVPEVGGYDQLVVEDNSSP